MTNSTTSNTTISTTLSDSDTDDISTMQSLNELLGFHYYETRAVFNVDGKEIVYINPNFLGRASIYLDGELIHKCWTWLPGVISDITVEHENHEYRVFSRIRNWVTMSQKITLIVDDSKAQSKFNPVLGDLRGWTLVHALIGPFLLGGMVGFVAGYFGN